MYGLSCLFIKSIVSAILQFDIVRSGIEHFIEETYAYSIFFAVYLLVFEVFPTLVLIFILRKTSPVNDGDMDDTSKKQPT
eukprot:CAMPEP_0117422854 /NCGR_PEP_ID=MMETSP0758-20121206/3607_1 /TAXON_ID=63605 /ORGANISM="Percolomonas cosmopolitus, Strain AE-1 (ATCC 50343)" /LENGTH=79 /DNA_ID=CAMNT_0005205717 /DNA_START=270 /DNA_END=506 /DNA_ORIENTATION=+